MYRIHLRAIVFGNGVIIFYMFGVQGTRRKEVERRKGGALRKLLASVYDVEGVWAAHVQLLDMVPLVAAEASV